MEEQKHQFDEQAALRALEHLRDQIQSARAQREQKIAEFEAFVRSNRTASQAERLAALDHREQAAPAAQSAARTAERAAESPLPPPAAGGRRRPKPAATPSQMFEPEPRSGTIAGASPLWRDRRIQVGAAVAVVALWVMLLAPWRARDSEPEPAAPAAAAGAVSSQPGSAAPAQPSSASSTPEITPANRDGSEAAPGAAGLSRPLTVDVRTIRPVWLRVTVDGERRVERQVPAGQSLVFGADRAVALRVGDAGAVQLFVDGVDQGVLGRDGQVVNRTFTPRPRQP